MNRVNGAARVQKSRPTGPTAESRDFTAGAGIITFGIACCVIALALVVAVAMAAGP